MLGPREECDDGDLRDGDGCSSMCEVECGGFVDPTTHHCYELHAGPLAWAAARDACIASGMGFDLAALTTGEEHDFVIAEPAVVASITLGAAGRIWIGGTDATLEGTFEWVTGEPWAFTAWTTGQPDDYMMNEDCAELWSSSGETGWNDQSCPSGRAFLCERPPAGQ
jgi:cysteine-rich repeat protein